MATLSLFSDNSFGPDQVLPAKSFKTSEPDGTIQIYRSPSGRASDEPVSVYTFFKQNAKKYQDHSALAIEIDGQWVTWTYMEYFKKCCIVAKALIKLGLEQFHGVCIMGCNCPEWMFSSIGAVFAGGFSAGVYTTNSPEACFTIASNCEAQVIFVEDNVCLNKFLAVKYKLPDIKVIVQWTGKPNTPGVISWTEFLTIGLNENDDALMRRLSLAAMNQCCTLIYTSGTTGPPKGVMISHDQMTWAAKQYKHIFKLKEKHENVISYLPLSHLAAHLEDIYIAIDIGATVYFAGPDALKGSLLEWLLKVKPTSFVGVPRVWEKMYEKMQEASANSGFLKKTLGTWAKHWGSFYYDALNVGRPLSTSESLKFGLANSLLLNKVKQALGFDSCLIFVSGSAPIDAEILKYFFSLNIPILEFYGLSESLSLCTYSSLEPNNFKLGSVGKILPTNEVKIFDSNSEKNGEGEICIRGRNIFMGYLKMPDKTDEAIDDEGWLHTGDIGWIDSEGFLYISGRIKELIITAGGENIPPLLIENAVKKELPCVSNAILIGDKRKYLTILLTFKSEMDMESGAPFPELIPPCQDWMRQIGCYAKTVQDAIQEIENHPFGSLAQAIQQGIDRYNNNHAFSNAQKIQRWSFLPHDFSLPTEELSNTLKLKRSFVLQKYADIIENMYSNNKTTEIMSKL